MDVQELLAADAGLPLGRRRAEVLDLLRAAHAPLGVQDVADRVDLHANSARFHLDALVEAGLAARTPRARSTPGRPSMVYQAVDGGAAAAGPRHFRLLAEMLTSLVAGMLPDPGQAATQAGREWGRYLTEQPAPYQRLSAAEAIVRLTATLEDIGFAPQAPDGEAPPSVLRLRQCPFREVAEGHQDVVCALHLGLMQGALAQMRAPVTADRLEPFAEPSLCLAHLEVRP
ncbi:MAG TPA: helix-turn-helix domain-containing protein [Streptosporangiaceae bacterium]|jgi:predicted ArsR family transcriptional regulator|nr:helix-turn-helix domain-containing protein [Streptosporangiaceae bacterium]